MDPGWLVGRRKDKMWQRYASSLSRLVTKAILALVDEEVLGCTSKTTSHLSRNSRASSLRPLKGGGLEIFGSLLQAVVA